MALKHQAVVARNIEVTSNDKYGNLAVTVGFDFLCPNCKEDHRMEEICNGFRLFSRISWSLPCGFVTVRMPWYGETWADLMREE